MSISISSSCSSAASPVKTGKPEDFAGKSANSNGRQLSEDEKKTVEKLKKIDTEVRAHEMAHMAAGGGVVRGGIKFQYSTGPDGNQYAVGGEVSIDCSPVSDNPRATIQKMRQVQSAAMAPANPSGQDQQVAAKAGAIAAKAMAEAAESSGLKPEKSSGYGPDGKVASKQNDPQSVLDLIA